MNAVAQPLSSLAGLLLLLAKSSLVIALAFALAGLLKRAPAAARHRLWALVLTLLFVLLLVPKRWQRPLPAPGAAMQATSISAVPPAADSSTQRAWRALPSVNWSRRLAWLWYGGAFLAGLYFLAARVQLSRLSRSARLADEALATELTKMAVEARISRPVALLVSDDVAVPLSWGIFNARILLPGDYTAWPGPRLANVLRHELAHMERLDALWQLLVDFVCALYWFNPLVWRAAMKIRMERELACDEAVLSAGASAPEYAADVAALATHLGFASLKSGGIAMAGCPCFPERAQALSSRPRHSSRLAFAGVFLIALAALPLAAFQLAQPGEQKTFPVPEKHVQDFQYAVTAGWYDQMVKLATADASLINSRAREGQTPLYLAVTSWSKLGPAEARWLLDHGADVNAPVSGLMGETALMNAAQRRNSALIRLLLDHGADIDAADNNGRTALDLSLTSRGIVAFGQDKAGEEAVKLLLDRGAKVSFAAAIRLPDLGIVRQYLTDDPSLVHKPVYGGLGKQTPLVYAIAARTVDHETYQPVVDALSAYIAEPDLCEASMLGRTDLVARYLDADPSQIGHPKKLESYFMTPLRCAVLANERGTILYLLNRGAKTDESLLHTALGTDADTMRLLLSVGLPKGFDAEALNAYAKQAEARGKKDIAGVLRSFAR